MSQYDESQISQWLREGIAAAKAGRRAQARELLVQVVEANERHEMAWIWLSSVVETDEDRLVCLENVLTLNPDNVQARAGLRWLQERGVRSDAVPAEPPSEIAEPAGTGHAPEQAKTQAGVKQEWLTAGGARAADKGSGRGTLAAADRKAEGFMSPDGCVYCGWDVEERDSHCPHCGNRLSSKRFEKDERSYTSALLHLYWLVLAGINVADFFVIGFVWNKEIKGVLKFIEGYLAFVAGPVVRGTTTLDTLLEPDMMVQGVRFLLLGLAVLGILVGLGLFLRISRAHPLGLALIAVYLVVGLLLFALGFTGYLIAVFRGLFIALLTLFMFQTVEDFAKEERRERLTVDRHLVNDADYYTRGRLYAKRGMWAKALLHWQRAVARNAARDTYFAALARAYAQLGRYEEALEQVENAIRVSPVPEEWESLRDNISRLQRSTVKDPAHADANVAPPLAFD